MDDVVEPLFDPPDHPAGPFAGDKILQHTEALRILALGGVPPPLTTEIDLTNACDLSCPYCTSADYKTAKESLTASVAMLAIEDILDLGGKGIIFTGGGEPLIHRHAAKLIAYVRYKGGQPALITNGLRLNTVDHALLVESCEWIRVSLDAHDEESYVRSKGRDSFKRIISNIELLVRDREARSRSGRATIGVGFLTHEGNFHHLPELAKLLSGIGVDYLQARPMIFLPGDPRSETFPQAYNPEVLAEARMHEHEGFRVYASMPKYEDIRERGRPYRRCYGVYFACAIGAGGDVWICCHARGDRRFSLGNVNRQGFRDIWQDVKRRREVYSDINLEECMPLCRMHAQNKLLDRINWRPLHEHFL